MSSFASPEALLSDLHWPGFAAAQKGTLTWSATSEDPLRAFACVVLVRADAVVCRVRSLTETRHTSLLESTWLLGAEGGVTYKGSTQANEAVPFTEAQALSRFKEYVTMMNAQPEFQGMGQRMRAQPAVAPATPRF